MSTPSPSRWRLTASIVALAALCAFGGFHLARLPYFLDPQARVAAQYRTVEYVNPWAGVKVMQYPNDLIVYQQIIAEQEPDFIIETGTNFGGLSLYLSSILAWVKPEARVLTVDIDGQYYRKTLAEKQNTPNVGKLFDRIEFFEGGSTDPKVFAQLRDRIGPGKKVLVILDALHTKDHVLAELKMYSPLVHPGGYIVATDTHIAEFGREKEDGPLAAVRAFLAEHPDFASDRSLERYIISANKSGWLRRKE